MTREHKCSVCDEWSDPTGEETWGKHRDALRAAGWTFPFPVVCPDCTEAHNAWFQMIYANESPGWHPLAKNLVLQKSAERN